MRFPWPKAKPLGQQGEDLAAKALKREGYTILDRNVHLGRYELDIIAREGDTVAFVEVKTRRRDDIASPEENITSKKRLHISRAANIYMSHADEPETYYRFDVVSVLIPERGKRSVTIFRDAFRTN